jgi:DNA-binding beta-propeller fold protein YncE
MRLMMMKFAFVLLLSVLMGGCNAAKQAASTPTPTPVPTPTLATATVAVGTGPVSVAVNSVTNQIYVANDNSNNVTVITP